MLTKLGTLLWIPYLLVGQGQQFKNYLPPSARSGISKIATVDSVGPDVIYATSDGVPVTLRLGPNAVVWKGRDYHDFSPVHAGDQIAASGTKERNGTIIISRLWDNIIHLSGTIARIDNPLQFEIQVSPSSTDKALKKPTIVTYNKETQFSDSDRGDLQIARSVDVIGLKLNQGHVQASKIIVYIGKRPARMPADAHILPPTPEHK